MFKKLMVFAFAGCFLVAALSGPTAAKSLTSRRNVPVYYLSLGTSLAAGVQADPDTGESVVTDVSYPSELAEILSQDIRKLRHVNLGCPGETAESFIYGGLCDYPQGSQLDQAIRFLHAHGEFTGLITIDIGANDVLQCVDGVEIDFSCIDEKIAQLRLDMAYIIETLRELAPNVPIVGMNYYNPLLFYWYYDKTFARMTIDLQLEINGVIEEVYTAYEIPVADVAEAFMSYDIDTLDGYGRPVSVDLLCAWTWMCRWQNIHPNDEGYAVIAEQFYAILPEIPVSTPPRKRFRHYPQHCALK